jgi:N-formylglutamate deformylase
MSKKDNNPGIYCILSPVKGRDLPFIIDSPHSGRIYPADFDHACTREALERAEDNQVDVLFEFAHFNGATLLTALFPRTYIDVNRAEDDIDPEILAEHWPGLTKPTPRSYAGIGLIRRLVRPGVPVYDHALSVAEIQARLKNYYNPYHAALKTLLDEAHYRFGKVWHLNTHSMPSSNAPVTHGILNMQPDFVLGDRDGTSCDIEFTHYLRDTIRGLGYRVAINNPYKGVEIVRRSADPARGRHSIQIEINKALYWDEHSNKRNSNFNILKSDIDKLVSDISDFTKSHLVNLAAD